MTLAQLLKELEGKISATDLLSLLGGQPVSFDFGPISKTETVSVFGKTLTVTESASGTITAQLK